MFTVSNPFSLPARPGAFPINKKIWTSSYVALTTGMATAILATLIWPLKCGQPLYLSPWNWWYERVTKHIPGAPELGSLAFALTVILFMWAVCYWLDKKKIYIKV